MNLGAVLYKYNREAEDLADRLGLTDDGQRNAFAHVYTSAQIARNHGSGPAWLAGVGQELGNHWTYRDGGNDRPDDPHYRRDSYRDMFNNEMGREIGRIGQYNRFSNQQIADYSRDAVLKGRAISDQYNDLRIPPDVGRLSTFDYLRGSNRPSIDDIRALAPPGTRFSPDIGQAQHEQWPGTAYDFAPNGNVPAPAPAGTPLRQILDLLEKLSAPKPGPTPLRQLLGLD